MKDMTKVQKLLLALTLQVVIILGMILVKISILTGGTYVLLQIAPVDPRDPLRGDYVTFQYDISTIQSSYFYDYTTYKATDLSVEVGDTVYVPLVQSGKYWTQTYGVSTTKPKSSEKLFIKGVVTRVVPSGSAIPAPMPGQGITAEEADLIAPSPTNTTFTVTVKYNIEEYFIPEGAGKGVVFSGNNDYAKVAIDSDGNAVLHSIYIDNKLWP